MSDKKTIATDVKTLSKGLLEIFNDLRTGTIKPEIAKESTNAAGKYLKAMAIQMEAFKTTDYNGEIEGLPQFRK